MPEDRIVRETLQSFYECCEETHKDDSELQDIASTLDRTEDKDLTVCTIECEHACARKRRCLNFLDIPLGYGTVDVR